MKRRDFLASASALLATQSLRAVLPAHAGLSADKQAGKADYSLRIGPCKLEIGRGVTIETTAYNGQVPGPMLRLREGVPVTIDVTNSSPRPDLVHWHGLA